MTNSIITMQDILVEGNEGTHGSVALWKSQVTFLGSTVFVQNYGHRRGTPGTLYARASTLIFQGNVQFMDNIGYNGGALSLCEGSKIVIGRQAQLKFIGNYAHHLGGAIYVDSANYHMLSDYKAVACFYEIAETSSVVYNLVLLLKTALLSTLGVLYMEGGLISVVIQILNLAILNLILCFRSTEESQICQLFHQTLFVYACALTQNLNAVLSSTTLQLTPVQQFLYLW